MRISSRTKKILTLALAAVGGGVMWYYLQCNDACAYLTGDIFGINLKYIGIPAMISVVICSLAGWDRMLRMGLAAAIGGEIFLFGYQVYQGIFCPYCLTFAATLILIFFVNYRSPLPKRTGWRRAVDLLGTIDIPVKGQSRTIPLSLCTLLGFLFFVVSFTGSAAPVYAEESPKPPFYYGGGRTEIRIYTDYFCPPCQHLESDAEAVLDQIVAEKKARVVFIDTPIHQEITPLYARYFFYATVNDRRYETAKAVRAVLFAAAKQGITSETAMIPYLKSKGVMTAHASHADYFKTLSGYIREDGIHTTPSCVVIGAGGKKNYEQAENILAALNGILKAKHPWEEK